MKSYSCICRDHSRRSTNFLNCRKQHENFAVFFACVSSSDGQFVLSDWYWCSGNRTVYFFFCRLQYMWTVYSLQYTRVYNNSRCYFAMLPFKCNFFCFVFINSIFCNYLHVMTFNQYHALNERRGKNYNSMVFVTCCRKNENFW